MTTLIAWPDSDDQHKYPTLAWVRAHQRVGGIGKGHQEGCDLDEDYIAYERARAEAAIQRLRLMNAVMQYAYNKICNARMEEFPGPLMWDAMDEMKKALQAIGEIP